MENDCQYERVDQDESEQILARVLEFRQSYDSYQKPHDVNALLGMFPHVSLQEGYVLDYVLDQAGSVQHILPFARSIGTEEVLIDPYSDDSRDELEDELYQCLSYELTAAGLFQYAFFVTELSSTRGSLHATEWLGSTPVFTRERFAALVGQSKPTEPVEWPEWFGPEAALGPDGGAVRFLVYTEIGWERVYHLTIEVDGRGRTDPQAGDVVADLGQGLIF